jgi:hypothetical protein
MGNLYFGIEMEILVKPKDELIKILVNNKEFHWDQHVTPASNNDAKKANRSALHKAVAYVLDTAGVPASDGEGVPFSKW